MYFYNISLRVHRSATHRRSLIVVAVNLAISLAVMGSLGAATSHDGRYAVMLWPYRQSKTIFDIVSKADGKILATGGLPNVVIAQSDADDFKSRLYAEGAVLVFNPLLVGPCRNSL